MHTRLSAILLSTLSTLEGFSAVVKGWMQSFDGFLSMPFFLYVSFFLFQDADTQRVMLRLSKEYPGDLGILMPLMLNLLQLKPGLAFFMTVDEPHAYLRGDILEVRYYIDVLGLLTPLLSIL